MYELNKKSMSMPGKVKRFSFFDFETFPNLWLVVFYNEVRGLSVIKSTDEDYRKRILDYVADCILVGFNIKNFDLRILNGVIAGLNPQQVYRLAECIINEEEHLYNNFNYWNKFNFIDLIDDNPTSLKEFEANALMGIKESEVPFGKEDLTDAEVDDIAKYCVHDVKATVKMFLSRMEYLKSKFTLANEFDMNIHDVMKSTNAKLVALIFDPVVSAMKFNLPFIVPDNLVEYFDQWLPEGVLDHYTSLPDINKAEDLECEAFNNKIVFGIGGIHSVMDTNIFAETDENKTLYDIDVTSYYPNMIIHYGYMSRFAKNKDLYKIIYEKRVKAKREGNKAVSNALKLVLNTTYGAMKNKYNKLYDPYQASNVCVLGQLMLCALANRIHCESNAKIIQTNTDGIYVLIPNSEKAIVEEIVKDWEQTTMMGMEWEVVKKLVQRDVNNYIKMGSKDEVTLKGKFANQAFDQSSNLNAPITHLAIVNYYLYGIPIEDTVKNNHDLKDFCFTTKTGRSYEKTFYEVDGVLQQCNKVNRCVATKNTKFGTIKKYKMVTKKKTGEVVEQYDKASEISDHVLLVNEPPETYDFDKLDIDFDWYIEFSKNKLVNVKKV